MDSKSLARQCVMRFTTEKEVKQGRETRVSPPLKQGVSVSRNWTQPEEVESPKCNPDVTWWLRGQSVSRRERFEALTETYQLDGLSEHDAGLLAMRRLGGKVSDEAFEPNDDWSTKWIPHRKENRT